jgi:CubicO group peptidase (beta-lactamase class C family)
MKNLLFRRWLCTLALLGLLFVILTGCSGAPAAAPTPVPSSGVYWPTQGWRTAQPEAQGMDAQKLDEMQTAIQRQHLDLHSLLIVHNGYLVSETYFGAYQAGTPHELYSCTKSFVSTLVGIALDQGKIDRTDHALVDFFSNRIIANLDARKQAITLDDVLTMRSGLDWQEGDPAYRELYNSRDWVQNMLDRPMAAAPGSQFNYCSGCSHLLSAVVQQATGMNPRAFAEQKLFKPLGISNFTWETDSAGLPIGGWGLQLTPRDMAKLGYLFLHGGQWDGKQIVSNAWVENATRKHTPGDGSLGYGYQWWTYPSLEAYTALGRYGQTIFVIPRLDLVIVTTAQIDNHDPIFELIEQYIVPAVN